MVTFDTGGRFGNQLFQYTVARLLDEKIGFELGQQYDWNDTITATPLKPGARYTNDRIVIKENVDTENILEMEYGKRHYHLSGFWQESHYYLLNREQILGFFNEKAPVKTDKKNIVMHVRLDDYKKFGTLGTVIDYQYYLDCLELEKFDELFIVTDEPGDKFFRVFKKYNPVFNFGTEKQDFWFLTQFDRIICGNSCFSWWAAFLSNASKVYMPKNWIRNSDDIKHDLPFGTIINSGFSDYV
jgi:hypothetical protein